MDEMRMSLKSKLLCGIVARTISNAVYKAVGQKPVINIKDLEVEMKDGQIKFHINTDGQISDKVLYKVNQLIE